MKRFIFSKSYDTIYSVQVDAESLEEAIKKADKMKWSSEEPILRRKEYKAVDIPENADVDTMLDLYDKAEWNVTYDKTVLIDKK